MDAWAGNFYQVQRSLIYMRLARLMHQHGSRTAPKSLNLENRRLFQIAYRSSATTFRETFRSGTTQSAPDRQCDRKIASSGLRQAIKTNSAVITADGSTDDFRDGSLSRGAMNPIRGTVAIAQSCHA